MKYRFRDTLLLLVAVVALTTAVEKIKYDNVILEGGGMKGVSYVGVFEALKKYGYYDNGTYDFENITGTSAGCLFGFALSLDVDPGLLHELVVSADFNRFFEFPLDRLLDIKPHWKDAYADLQLLWEAVSAYNRHNSSGLNDAQEYKKWLVDNLVRLSPHRDALAKEGPLSELTFGRLWRATKHRLNCLATQLGTNLQIRYNVDISPDENVYKVIYRSGGLPFVFKPTVNREPCPIVDGGLLNNFAINEYDTDNEPNPRSLGLSLNRKIENSDKICSAIEDLDHENREVHDTGDFYYSNVGTMTLVKMITDVIMNKNIVDYSLDPRNENRIVYLDSRLSVYDFRVSREKRQAAIADAYDKTVTFLDGRLENVERKTYR